MTAKYFLYPFGVTGDRTTVPDIIGDGTVDYQIGFGPDYSLVLGSDAGALAIPRRKFNQIMYDITTAIQQYQQFSVPDFITSAMNGGSAFSYSKGVRVRYDPGTGPVVYESKINSNTDLPTVTASWQPINQYAANTVLANNTGSVGGPQGVALSTSQLLGRGTSGNVTAIAIDGTTITMTGTTLSASVPAPINISAGFVCDFAGATAPSGWLVCDGSAVSRTTYATLFAAIGTTWGAGNGTTTFNLPDCRRSVRVGAGGTATATLGNAVGNKGGTESEVLSAGQIPSVTVSGSISGSFATGNDSYSGGTVVYKSGSTGSGSQSVTGSFSGSSAGGSTPISHIQPSAVFLTCIKT